MNTGEKNLTLMGLVAFLATLIQPVIFPSLSLMFFAPFFVVLCYQKPLTTCVCWAFTCGLCIDLLSSDTRLGFTASSYSAAVLLLFSQRRHFFADRFSTLPVMVFLFSVYATLFQMILLPILEPNQTVSWSWIATDLIILPVCDAIYATLCFVTPSYYRTGPPRSGKEYFFG